MSYTIQFKPAAVRDLRKLPKAVQKRIAAEIDALACNPRPPGIDTLKGEAGAFYRLRVGDYRVIYQVQDRPLLVLVLRAGHRREVYRLKL